jgi:predicted CxxxxCH...CXXCH cytochrome family protein
MQPSPVVRRAGPRPFAAAAAALIATLAAVALGLAIAAALGLVGCADERSQPGGGGATGGTVHPAGLLDPASDDFHAQELRRHDWDFAVCARCHGDDFAGGAARKSCLTCHTEGPTACVTCHGAGPTSNAHAVHREVAGLGCAECHVVPARWDDEGHLRRGGVAITTPAPVVFGARAQTTLDPADRSGPPSWRDGACQNVYCHGAALHAAGGTATSPRWDDPAPAGACDRCHGAPPPGHAQSQCATCHPTGAAHLDGAVQIGLVPDAGCSGCHGDATSPAPPRDLAGNTAPSAIGVGAHRKHLTVPSGLRGPIPCSDCHAVPSRVDDPGHIDSALPAEVLATLSWDRTAQTCGSSTCHVGSRPVWTVSGGVVCGSCHGIPPAGLPHNPAMTLATCTTCHPGTVDEFGKILLTVGPGGTTSLHLNGVVDVP